MEWVALKALEPQQVPSADLRVKNFIYSSSLCLTLRSDLRQNPLCLGIDKISVYVLSGNTLRGAFSVPLKSLASVDEVWLNTAGADRNAKIFVTDVFDQYSYFVKVWR